MCNINNSNKLQIYRGFYTDWLSEECVQTDRLKITNRCSFWAPFGNKAGGVGKERTREEREKGV